MKIRIDKIGINGEGIGYIDSKPVFVKGALPNELVEAKITLKERNYSKAECVKVIKASKERIKPLCPYYERCGACQLMHLDYEAQLRYKVEILKEALYKYADIDDSLIEDIIRNNDIFGYRNSLKLPITSIKGKLVSGLYENESNHILKVDECLIHDKDIERVKKNVLNVLNKYAYNAYNFKDKTGIRALAIRKIDDSISLVIVSGNTQINKECIDDLSKIKGLKSIYQSIHTTKSHEFFGNQMIHLYGSKYITFKFNNLKMNLSARSFFQLNTKQAIKLYNVIRDEVKENQDVIFEAYSGIGAISLILSDKASKIIGVESIADAVNNANKNARDNHIENVSFECDDAAISLKRHAKKMKIDTLVVDPPRVGLDDDMLETILKSKIKNIIYVSCNPATLAKNLSILKSRYQIKKIIPLDMFSNSAHIESITVLKYKKY